MWRRRKIPGNLPLGKPVIKTSTWVEMPTYKGHTDYPWGLDWDQLALPTHPHGKEPFSAWWRESWYFHGDKEWRVRCSQERSIIWRGMLIVIGSVRARFTSKQFEQIISFGEFVLKQRRIISSIARHKTTTVSFFSFAAASKHLSSTLVVAKQKNTNTSHLSPPRLSLLPSWNLPICSKPSTR